MTPATSVSSTSVHEAVIRSAVEKLILLAGGPPARDVCSPRPKAQNFSRPCQASVTEPAAYVVLCVLLRSITALPIMPSPDGVPGYARLLALKARGPVCTFETFR